jgi:hypothetical protein
MDPHQCSLLLDKYDTFTSQFCTVDRSLQKLFSFIGIASCVGILLITFLTIKKGIKKKKQIVEPTGRHENETYCVLSLVITRLMITYLVVYSVFLTIQIVKLSLGSHYNYYYMTKNQRSCNAGKYSKSWVQNVNWFVIIEFLIDTLGRTLQSLIILC